MTPVVLLGWLAAVVGDSIAVPQVVRLLRTRDVSGLSLFGWQTIVSINVAWAVHGFRVGQANMVVANLVGFGMTALVLGLIARELRLNLGRLLLPGVLAAGVMIVVDVLFGAGIYGAVAIIPAVMANSAQSVELVRSPRIDGVSPIFLGLAVLNQALWFSWGLLVPEYGTIVSSSVTLAVTVFNMVWWGLRKLGLRSFGKPTDTELVAATHVAAVEVER
ncbi:MAG: hypothetical protein J0I14_17195 [Propionibacteriaceae bacterium]|nr:hypothetical protein [Propionibacteriaceae bacterium]